MKRNQYNDIKWNKRRNHSQLTQSTNVNNNEWELFLSFSFSFSFSWSIFRTIYVNTSLVTTSILIYISFLSCIHDILFHTTIKIHMLSDHKFLNQHIPELSYFIQGFFFNILCTANAHWLSSTRAHFILILLFCIAGIWKLFSYVKILTFSMQIMMSIFHIGDLLFKYKLTAPINFYLLVMKIVLIVAHRFRFEIVLGRRPK